MNSMTKFGQSRTRRRTITRSAQLNHGLNNLNDSNGSKEAGSSQSLPRCGYSLKSTGSVLISMARKWYNTIISAQVSRIVSHSRSLMIHGSRYPVRFSLKDLERDYEKTEDDIKAVQSVGQIIGEVMKQLDDERCEFSVTSKHVVLI
jgi:hypothetical protein